MPEDTPRGVRDFSPAEAISLRYITGVVEEVFKRFGFYPLETPAIENISTLNAKDQYSEEQQKEIFTMKDEQTGLRYDFTVPLARYVASNKDISLPFKRYQIGNAWRRDEPQRMRYREFMQADVDVVGSAEPDSDAEVIAATALAIEETGIRDYAVLVSSRELLRQVILGFGVPADKEAQAVRIIDKLQKIKRDEALAQLSELAKGQDAERLLGFMEQEGSNEEMLQKIAANIEGSKALVERMQELLKLLGSYRLNGKVVFDMTLARGFDYYTGFVWEFAVEENGRRSLSIGGGGRYDGLIGIYSKRATPATGSSLGISRMFEILNGASKKTYAKVFVAYIGQQNRDYALNAATEMRGNGIYVDLNTSSKNISKQLEYAGSLDIPNVLIVGDQERQANKVKLRNMQTGEEGLITLQEAIEKLK
ncbi:MAG: histidine--tRNA ligase [Candidatus Marsarchaeota archaeon]|nr:histidine--tRNA ligase [Candidatus Marsarchaeota archaeon]